MGFFFQLNQYDMILQIRNWAV